MTQIETALVTSISLLTKPLDKDRITDCHTNHDSWDDEME